MEYPIQDMRTLVTHLKNESGLTANQLGRLLGVTNRSIHHWVAGSPVAVKYEDRIRTLSEVVFGLNASTPEDRRAMMLDSRSGPSLFKHFLDTASHPERLQYSIPVSERFEGGRDGE